MKKMLIGNSLGEGIMRLKQELIGASVALAVTVIGGLLVYMVTREPGIDRKELLTYEIDKQVSFTGKDKSFSIGSLRFENSGEVAAKDVVATIMSGGGAKILEINTTRKAGPDPSAMVKSGGHTASITVEHLLPGDLVHGTYLLDKPGKVTFDLRSTESIGKPRSAVPNLTNADARKSLLNRTFERYLPILFLLSFAPLFILRKISKKFRYQESRNNNAFVLMHTGHAQDACDLLKVSVETGQDGAIGMANYSGALALLGDLDSADKYLRAADFLAVSAHEKAIVKLNSAIISQCKDDKPAALQSIKEAVALSKDDLREYFSRSAILKKMVEWHPLIGAAADKSFK